MLASLYLSRSALLAAVGATFVACAGTKGEVFGKPSNTVVHLVNGDSIELQLTLPAVVQGSPPGRMFVFYPFRELSDVPRLREAAVALFWYLRPQIDSSHPAFVVLRAVNLPAARRQGFYNIENYGFVVEPHADRQWYFLGEADPVPPPNKRLKLTGAAK